MLKKIDFTVPKELLVEAAQQTNLNDFRYSINRPTGRFFYDPWEINPELKGTIWDKLLSSLSLPVGEARIIVLEPTKSYHKHADIDDRYHLNIKSEACYLIDFDNNELHEIFADGQWYEMDAGRLHTASNFGRDYRIQLVVRKLLTYGNLVNPIKIRLSSTGLEKEDARFMFDNILSPQLNHLNKIGAINDFKFATNEVTCNLEGKFVEYLKDKLQENFHLEIL